MLQGRCLIQRPAFFYSYMGFYKEFCFLAIVMSQQAVYYVQTVKPETHWEEGAGIPPEFLSVENN
jgi:hypothetical protein